MKVKILRKILAIIASLNFEYKKYQHRQAKMLKLKNVTEINRGNASERALILMLLDYGINFGAIFHDLYVRKNNGKFSQIDLVVPTSVGVIVFEVKDYSGWIFGNGFDSKWTQVLAYGNQKYTFYNPIKQNNGHIDALKQYHCFKNIPFFSVIVFYGDCELKEINCVPNGVYVTKEHRLHEVLSAVLNDNELVCYKDKKEVIKILNNAKHSGECENVILKHDNSVKDLLGEHRVFK